MVSGWIVWAEPRQWFRFESFRQNLGNGSGFDTAVIPPTAQSNPFCNPTHGSGWFPSDPFYTNPKSDTTIPPTAVGGSFRSFLHPPEFKLIPPTAVGGSFRSFLHSPDFKLIPPTAVGGSFRSALEKDLNNPPTAVGGIVVSH